MGGGAGAEPERAGRTQPGRTRTPPGGTDGANRPAAERRDSRVARRAREPRGQLLFR